MDDNQIQSFVHSAYAAANNLSAIANAIVPRNTFPGTDAAGGTVTSLTEAVMGMTAGLHRIAESISDLAEAVRER